MLTVFDKLSRDMIILTLPAMLKVITATINKSIETSTFPSSWKIALVRPLPKNNDPKDLKDLRPISILPFLAKILEKVIYNQVIKFCDANNILPDLQSGFRKGRSTSTALLDVVDNILTSQDSGRGTILTLLDFSRAFDSINIDLLLSKLSFYGFVTSSIKWFQSYLCGRSQQVILNQPNGSSLVSEQRPLNRGVPQGSILGPLLFIIYTADITNCMHFCKYHLYADDLQVYLSCNSLEFLFTISNINEDLNRIAI
ncbi:unnamed protein product [Parnassius mnemosyne]|uniref:Reverse transcriptase domain-containing protein n=1 Tax=Parnassius mnemosyne TaxID=213953 RepID=A0AAV1M2M3_9NEOP